MITEEEEEESKAGDEVGVDYLLNDLSKEEATQTAKSPVKATGASADTGDKEQINDIAATAESIQPTGYTLETTKVRNSI